MEPPTNETTAEETLNEKQQQPSPDINELVDLTHLVTDLTAHHLNCSTCPYLADPETFELHDAMSATQLLDPLMDGCQIPAHLYAPWNQHPTTTTDAFVFPRPLPDSLNDPMTPLPWELLKMRRVRIVALQILVRFQSLLSGSGVGDSVYTCLYAHYGVVHDMLEKLVGTDANDNDDVSLAQALERLQLGEINSSRDETVTAQWGLFACVLLLVELAESIRIIVQKADIFEEEDFVVQTHQLRAFAIQEGEVNRPKILQRALHLLGEVENGGDADDNRILQEDARVIRLVIEFQNHMLQACSLLERLTRASRLPNVTQAQSHIEQALARLDSLSELVVQNDDDDDDDETKAVHQQCFDSFISRQLVGNLPVRKISFSSPQESIPVLRDITKQMDYGVCRFHLRGSKSNTSLSRICRLLRPYSQYNILVRSLVVLNLYYEDHLLGVHNMPNLIASHIQQLSYPTEQPISHASAAQFYSRLAKPIYDTLKLALMHETRQRGYLEAVILPDWSVLQNEAKIVDVHCATPHHSFFYYTLVQTVRLMERFVQAGLVTQLFHPMPTDLVFAYWYRDCLIAVQNQHLQTMYQSKDAIALLELEKQQQQPLPRKESSKSGKGKKKSQSQKKNNKQRKQQQQQPPTIVRTVQDQEEMFSIQVMGLQRNLCRTTVQFITALKQAGVLELDDNHSRYEFTNLATIFEKRFEAFQVIEQPPPYAFRHFQAGTDFTNYTTEQLQHYVGEGFQTCRSSIEILLVELEDRLSAEEEDEKTICYYGNTSPDELRALRKVCVGNGIYLHKLRQTTDAASLRVEFDFGTHAEFCIIKLLTKERQ